jgi:hypothetical protein
MKKIPKSKIPENLLKWCDDLDDFWLTKYIRSIGYTRDEIIELSEKNIKIKCALRMAVDSLIDKAIYMVGAGYFSTEFADFMVMYYIKQFNLIRKGKLIDIKLGGENFEQ